MSDMDKTEEFYKPFIEFGKTDEEKVGWVPGTQDENFMDLSRILPPFPTKILDAGCGLGDFLAWQGGMRNPTQYLGVDVNPLFIALAKERYPMFDFLSADIFSLNLEDKDFRYVIASGLFSVRLFEDDEGAQYQWAIDGMKKLLSFCSIGVAANFLTGLKTEKLFNYDPAKILWSLKQEVSPRIRLNWDTQETAFSVFLYK